MQVIPESRMMSPPQYFEAGDFPPLSAVPSVETPGSSKKRNNRKGRRGGRGGRGKEGNGKVAYTKLDMTEHFDTDDPAYYVDEEDEDYRLALSLQEELDRQDTGAAEEIPIAQPEKEKEEVPVEVPSSEPDYDADLALAMQLQAQLNEQSYGRSTTSNEKVLVQRAVAPQSPLKSDYLHTFHGDDDYDDEDEDDDDYEEEFNERYNNPHMPSNYTGVSSKPYHQIAKPQGRKPAGAKEEMVTKHDPLMDAIQNAAKMEKFVEAGDMESMKVAGHAYNYLKNASGRQETELRRKRSNKKDKSTSDSVVDTGTRMALYKMLNAGVLEELNGVISTGKESHVYHAVTGDNKDVEGLVPGQEVAIKIYNMEMSSTGFKDRLKYVDGEFRYRHTPTQNSRKAIKVWAEKELRNLKRLQKGGIASPKPILLRNNVLIMSFIGKNGTPAPRLKDANLSTSRLQEVYMQFIMMLRDVYQNCLLVHADLSEYNILYHKKQLYFIDVSQAVENDHENALEFLKRDCEVMTNFFMKRRLNTAMSARELFNFVTDTSIAPENIDSYLEAVQNAIAERLNKEQTREEEIEENVWRDAYIPRTLNDVSDRMLREEVEGRAVVRHGPVTGMRTDLSGPACVPEILDPATTCEKVRE